MNIGGMAEAKSETPKTEYDSAVRIITGKR
jgi:hypothetical protein